MAKNGNNGKGGRPPITIRWDEFEKLCAMQCTEEEIASWFGCSVDTVERRCKEKYKACFAEVFAEKRGAGKVSLRRAQWQVGVKGNVTMLIWLGKQYLGQKDRQEIEHGGNIEVLFPESMKDG
ncbi:MAG: hypothetical protein WC683_09610 [bacterium]